MTIKTSNKKCKTYSKQERLIIRTYVSISDGSTTNNKVQTLSSLQGVQHTSALPRLKEAHSDAPLSIEHQYGIFLSFPLPLHNTAQGYHISLQILLHHE